MASSPITSWQIDRGTMETVADFILGGSKITANGDCSHEIKRGLLLGRKVMTNLDSILQSRDITLPTKVHLIKAIYGFSSGHVWMWELDYNQSWAPKNWCFELWCWRRLLRVPWIARRSYQSILKEYSGLIIHWSIHWKDWCWNSNTLATWCGELTNLKRPWCWERLKAAGEGDYRGWDGWMASLTWRTWVWVGSGIWWWTGMPGMLQSLGSQRVRHDGTTELTDHNFFIHSSVDGHIG